MGREIRNVPVNWEHPKKSDGSYQPMYNRDYEEELNEWIENHYKWLKKEHEDQENDGCKEYKYYAEWGGNPPNIEFYMTDKRKKTWFQLYETISEGTPLSPPFETKEKLRDWLANNKDFWGYSRNKKEAQLLVDAEWCPSGMIINNKFYLTDAALNIKE